MKRYIKLFSSLLVLCLMSFTLVSCYVSKPAAMSKLIGTYSLVKYTYKESEAEGDPTDKIKEEGIVAYLVITGEDYGYYVYKDSSSEVIVQKVKVTYVYDEDEPELVKEITYDNGLSIASTPFPGCGKEVLGLNFRMFSKTLNNTYNAVFGRKFTQSVSYKKVSSKSDLSYASKKMKMELDKLVVDCTIVLK